MVDAEEEADGRDEGDEAEDGGGDGVGEEGAEDEAGGEEEEEGETKSQRATPLDSLRLLFIAGVMETREGGSASDEVEVEEDDRITSPTGLEVEEKGQAPESICGVAE